MLPHTSLGQAGIQSTFNGIVVACFNYYLPRFWFLAINCCYQAIASFKCLLSVVMVQQSKNKLARGPCVDPRFATELVPLNKFNFHPCLSGFPLKKKKIKSQQQVYPVPKESNYRNFQQLQKELD